jgi:anaerobic selenocysteine-containing dehydrogenase
MREGIDKEAFSAGKGVEVSRPPDSRSRYQTPSGKIEILNSKEPHPLPCYLAPYGGDYPFRLMTAPSFYALNSSFREREDLRTKDKGMYLKMNPADAILHLQVGQTLDALQRGPEAQKHYAEAARLKEF